MSRRLLLPVAFAFAASLAACAEDGGSPDRAPAPAAGPRARRRGGADPASEGTAIVVSALRPCRVRLAISTQEKRVPGVERVLQPGDAARIWYRVSRPDQAPPTLVPGEPERSAGRTLPVVHVLRFGFDDGAANQETHLAWVRPRAAPPWTSTYEASPSAAWLPLGKEAVTLVVAATSDSARGAEFRIEPRDPPRVRTPAPLGADESLQWIAITLQVDPL